MMQAHRIANQMFINDLKGTGAAMYGGRWNPQDVPCLYCSEHLSLAVLEKFVHAQTRADMVNLASIRFEVTNPDWLYVIDISKLTRGWQQNISYTQWLGAQILGEPAYLGFVAPSVVVESEMNVVLNPKSELFHHLVVHASKPFVPDSRMTGRLG
jgi:RES domain-containing protein